MELRDVEARLGDPQVQTDPQKLADLGRRFKSLNDIVTVADSVRAAIDDQEAARSMLGEATPEERAELERELTQLAKKVLAGEEELRVLMLPKDPNDDRNVIIELRGAAGGEEANLFARDLLEMYEAYAKRQGWKFEILSTSPSDLGGVTEATAVVSGDSVWTRLKHEAGVHRVQRVPVTESQGRIHTSSATVMILPEADEVEFEINENDLQIDVYRSSGPGGQSVNTTDSAVRITHLPTGEKVSIQDQKSQLQNKAKALQVLRSRLWQREQDRIQAEQSEIRRGQVGDGDRSAKIRTYNAKENRVTDHRIGLTLHKLDRVMAGELDEVSDALVQEERRQQLEEGE